MPRVSLEIPPGIFGDDTTFAASGRWATCSNVRFWQGRPQVIGGWEGIFTESLTGVCRSVFQWTDNDAAQNIAFGTNSALQVWQSGELATITPTGLAEGSVDGTGGAGYGTGTYSTGEYSEPSTDDYFPRTWSLAAWGENLLASPRGGKLYRWQNNTSVVAAEVVNAPDQITHMLVSPQDQVFALGCNQEASGDFDPLTIRHSSTRNLDEWTTGAATTAREYRLPGGGRIVAGRFLGPYLLVWTTHALFLGTYVGSLTQVWRFERVGLNCGLLGPNAAVVVGQNAFWLGPDLQFRRYGLGGAPQILSSPVQDDMSGNLAASQGDKVVAASISKFNEIRFDYPDSRDGVENSRYVALSLVDGAWSRGAMSRTAFCDAGPSEFPIGVSYVGRAYWHERGESDDGGAFAWSIRTADQYLSEDQTMMVRGFWPDIKDQVGPVHVTFRSRLKPQGNDTERTYGPISMGVGDDKVDVRLTGRLFSVELSGNSSPTAMRLGKPVVDLVSAGQR